MKDSGKVLSDKDSAALMTAMNTAGVFVTCGLETPNIMVTHWGALGKLWGKQIFSLPIRSTKYSYRIVKETKSFAVNVPARDMRTEISLCDTISGFKVNKFETLNLHPKRARSIDAYVLGECGLIVEYKVIAIIPPESIDKQIDDLFVSSRPHTLFVGEVVDAYRLK
ncbi:MAG: flavin reductase [Clostridiales bacterium]|nr:flavin reductase [Clostridiales bacterium]